jgi:hypothetical protein
MSEKMAVFRARQAKKSRENQTHGFLSSPEATVPMSAYLKVLDDMNTWRKRAVDAEARLCGSGDILADGRFEVKKGD